MDLSTSSLRPADFVLSHYSDSGERSLREIGFRQLLKRDLSIWSSYCFGLTFLATPLTLTWLYTVGYYNGGPVTIVWGWLIVSFFTMFIVLSLAEMLSALPTAGGIYYQAFHFGGELWGPIACWWTGWLHWAAYVSTIGSVNYMFAQMLALVVLLATGFYVTPMKVVFAMAVLAAGLEVILSLFPVHSLGRIMSVGAMVGAVTSLAITVLLPALAPKHQTMAYVFTGFNNNAASAGLNSRLYLVSLGLLMSQDYFSRIDICGHMSEETKGGDRSSAMATIASTLTGIVLGFGLLVAITFSIQDLNNVLNPDNQTMGSHAAAQIFYDVFKARFGSGVGAMVLLGWISVCCIFANVAAITAASRLYWAMSRDGATPWSKFWSYLTPEGKIPLYAILLTAAASILFMMPICWDVKAITAINSFSSLSTYFAYVIPIILKLTSSRQFVPGPMSFGRWSTCINMVAILWVCGISVLYCVPTVYPVSLDSTNFTPWTFACLFVLITFPWLLPKKIFNFQGPICNLRKDGTSVRNPRLWNHIKQVKETVISWLKWSE